LLQFGSYLEDFCFLYYSDGRTQSYVKYIYPYEYLFSDRKCLQPVSSNLLSAGSCFDWVDSYGYSTDDMITPYAPFMLISEVRGSVSSYPSFSPSVIPSGKPSISAAPSSISKTFSPTHIRSRSVSPTVSTLPLNPLRTGSPTQKISPTVSPSRPTADRIDESFSFQVTQVRNSLFFCNPCGFYFFCSLK
jgi:hypothetical protein